MNASLLPAERVSLTLRGLYQSFGYTRYRVGKFEEYDLYARNRNFLSDDRILTFSDINGQVMALKPDVTLSIIKNTRGDDRMRKVWYTENVYRVPRGGDGFQEIRQTGLECIGTVDLYTMGEVLMLAARSLETIAEEYVLEVSHMGILTGLLEARRVPPALAGEILVAFGEKNPHAVRELCRQGGMSDEAEELFSALCVMGGPAEETLPQLLALPLPAAGRAAAEELAAVCRLLKTFGSFRVEADLSVTNDTDYYNGILFRGFVDGIAAPVLSGGRYDHLLNRMGKSGAAIGFAVYLSELERLIDREGEYEADTLLLYGDGCDPAAVAGRVKELAAEGKTVRVQPKGKAEIRCRETEEVTG